MRELAGCSIRIWQVTGAGALRPLDPSEASVPDYLVVRDGRVESLDEHRFVGPLESLPGHWFELEVPEGISGVENLGRLLECLLEAERETELLAGELAHRYEEINLLYSIAETLGRTVSLTEACEIIVAEVAGVVGAGRGSIFVYDEGEQVLRPVAGCGIDVADFLPVDVADETSVAARAFRERQIVSFDPSADDAANRPSEKVRDQAYRGSAFLSVPILYPVPGAEPRAVGVINLTDRQGPDSFQLAHHKLMAATANQIGAAIENARLVERDLARQRLNQELALAREMQHKLLPRMSLSGEGYDFAAKCHPAEAAGGDFYKFFLLSEGRVGVVLGDVSSHGFSAALMMALVLSAVGIHGENTARPDEAIRRLLASVSDELASADMHLSIFYGVADLESGVLQFANAGHPHAFLMRPGSEALRLGASCPPLGLCDAAELRCEKVDWVPRESALVLFSDGIADVVGEKGVAFGESRVVETAERALREGALAAEVLDTVFTSLASFGGVVSDDQTLAVLKG